MPSGGGADGRRARFAQQEQQQQQTTTKTTKTTMYDETTTLLLTTPSERPVLVHRDSEFTVSSDYQDDAEHNTLNAWQGAALLTADCLGTGLLALPNDIKELGIFIGLGFLILNLPINFYAGYIFHKTATAVEEHQKQENRAYSQTISILSNTSNTNAPTNNVTINEDDEYDDDNDEYDDDNESGNERQQQQRNNNNYEAINQDTIGSTNTFLSLDTLGNHDAIHHDTATFDFIGMTVALFKSRRATKLTMCVYYINIFLVLGNYILVMSHAVAAAIGEDHICLPTAGLIAATGMFAVSQSRTMAKLGRLASIISLSALFVVVIQCLYEVRQQQHTAALIIPPAIPNNNDNDNESNNDVDDETGYMHFLRKLSALGSIGFAVGSQKLFLNIRHELRDRSTAPISLGVSLTAFGTFYIFICLAAGSQPPSFLFDAIPQHTINRRIAGILLWIHVIVSYAINSQAICSSMDRLLWRKVVGIDMEPWARWMILSGFMAVTAYTVSNAVPFFKDLVALIGAVTSVPLTLLLPAIFWRKHINVGIFTINEAYGSALLTYFSLIFMVAATIGSLYSIRLDWSEHGAPFACH